MIHSKRLQLFVGLVAIAGTLAASSARGAEADVAELWSKNCAICHGKDAKGDTKSGKQKGVKDLTDPKIHAALKRDEMIKKMKDGILDEKTGKERMKPFKDKLDDAQLGALADWVLALKP